MSLRSCALAGVAVALAACGAASPSPTSSTTPAPATFKGAGFGLSVPVGWHAATIVDHGAQGMLYGLASTNVALAESGLSPDGVIGIEIAVVPVAVIPPQVGDVAAMTPSQLLSKTTSVPKGATVASHGPVTTLAIGGTPAATADLTYTESGKTRTDVDIAAYRGGTVYLIQMESQPDLVSQGRQALTAVIASWTWDG